MKTLTVVALCLSLTVSVNAQSWRLGLNGGMSQTLMSADWNDDRKPLLTWNANLELNRRTQRHFEYGAEISVQPIVDQRTLNLIFEDEFDPMTGFKTVTRKVDHYWANPSISLSLKGGYFWEKAKHSLGIGGGVGYCLVPEFDRSKYVLFNNNEMSAPVGGRGIVETIYLRYAFAIGVHFGISAAVQPRFYQLHYKQPTIFSEEQDFSGYSLPVSVGVVYKF